MQCIPGGLHAHDTVQGAPASDASIVTAIEAARVDPSDEGAMLSEADRASFVGAAASDLQRGLHFWASWDCKLAFQHQHQTFFDVPTSLRSAFAEGKGSIVADGVHSPRDGTDAILLWHCLSIFDALVLHSSRQ